MPKIAWFVLDENGRMVAGWDTKADAMAGLKECQAKSGRQKWCVKRATVYQDSELSPRQLKRELKRMRERLQTKDQNMTLQLADAMHLGRLQVYLEKHNAKH